jgi:hypothetical protein
MVAFEGVVDGRWVVLGWVVGGKDVVGRSGGLL